MNEETNLPTLVSPELAKELNNLSTDFSEAEKLLKEVENIGENFYAAVANELRYAGRHLLNALVSPKDWEDELRRAAKHCYRATYDASDALVIHRLEVIEIFIEDYRKISLIDTVPEWHKYVRKAADARKFIASTVEREKARSEHAKACLVVAKELENITIELTVLRPELNKKIREKSDERLKWVLGVALALAAVIAGVLAL